MAPLGHKSFSGQSMSPLTSTVRLMQETLHETHFFDLYVRVCLSVCLHVRVCVWCACTCVRVVRVCVLE